MWTQLIYCIESLHFIRSRTTSGCIFTFSDDSHPKNFPGQTRISAELMFIVFITLQFKLSCGSYRFYIYCTMGKPDGMSFFILLSALKSILFFPLDLTLLLCTKTNSGSRLTNLRMFMGATPSQVLVLGLNRSTEFRQLVPSLPPATYSIPSSTATPALLRRLSMLAIAVHVLLCSLNQELYLLTLCLYSRFMHSV